MGKPNGGTTDEIEMVEMTNDCFLTQFVKAPTRGEACLDLVFSNNEFKKITGSVKAIAQPDLCFILCS